MTRSALNPPATRARPRNEPREPPSSSRLPRAGPPPSEVTTLTTPPIALEPYSEEPEPRRISRRSRFVTISPSSKPDASPCVAAASRSRKPSSRTAVSSVRRPRILIEVNAPVPPRLCTRTPGTLTSASGIASSLRRSISVSWMSVMAFEISSVDCAVPDAVTTTWSNDSAGWSRSSRMTVCRSVTTRVRAAERKNPAASACTTYSPGATASNTNSPAAFVTPVRRTRLSRVNNVKRALRTRSPCGSSARNCSVPWDGVAVAGSPMPPRRKTNTSRKQDLICRPPLGHAPNPRERNVGRSPPMRRTAIEASDHEELDAGQARDRPRRGRIPSGRKTAIGWRRSAGFGNSMISRALSAKSSRGDGSLGRFPD